MPKIPIYKFAPTASGPANVRVDPNVGAASAAATQRLAGTVAAIGEKLNEFAQKKQVEVDKGILANESIERMKVDASIEDWTSRNPDDPEGWKAKGDELWKDYSTKSRARADKDKWGADLSTVNSQQSFYHIEQNKIKLGVVTSKAEITKSNNQQVTAAYGFLRAGDYKAFSDSINGLQMPKGERQEFLRKGLDTAAYSMGQEALSLIEDLSPALQKAKLALFEDKILKKGEGGKHTMYEWEDGGMSLAHRTRLAEASRSQAIRIQRRIDTNANSLAKLIAAGGDMREVDAALDAGEIDQDAYDRFDDDFSAAATKARMKREAKQHAAMKAEADRVAGQHASMKAFNRDSSTGKTNDVGILELNRLRDAKKISPEQYKTATKNLLHKAAIQTQELRFDENSIVFEIEELSGSIANGNNEQLKDKKVRELMDKIQESGLNRPARARLVGMLLDVKSFDLNDSEEEGSHWFWDRKGISQEEVTLRKSVIATLKEHSQSLGDLVTGQTLFFQEKVIRNLFKEGKAKPTEQQIQQAKEELTSQIADASEHEVMESIAAGSN